MGTYELFGGFGCDGVCQFAVFRERHDEANFGIFELAGKDPAHRIGSLAGCHFDREDGLELTRLRQRLLTVLRKGFFVDGTLH